MNQYEANLLTLTALDAELAAAVSRAQMSSRARILPAASGAATAEIRSTNGVILLHSRHDPVEEAQAFARTADTGKITTYIVLGFGLGYHIKALLAAARKESLIIVIEKDVALFRAAMESVDLREVFASRRVVPIVGKSVPEIFAALAPHLVSIFLDAVYLVHRPSAQSDPEYYQAANKGFSDYVAYGLQNIVTTVSIDLASKANCLMNLPYYLASPGISRYKDAFAGFPAIVVSAGPSLHRNIETLRQARGKAVIIAVSTVFRPLMRRGIKPDFTVVLDYHPISKKYFEDAPGDEDVVLVADPKASYEAVEAHRGPKAVIHNDALHNIIGSPAFHKGAIPSGTTVAHSAFYFAQHIGADPIIFVGQDLAHPDGVTHVPGTAVHDLWAVEANRFDSLEMREWETILRMKEILLKVKDVHGNDVYTDGQMFAYLQQFEMSFYNSKAAVIDATEGGAAKKYTTAMTLADALAKYATRGLPAGPASVPSTSDTAAEGGRAAAESTLESRLARMGRIRGFYDRTLSILKRIEKLWPDQEAIGPLLVDIEGIREEVKTYTDVNSLVRDVAQASELRKIQRDRAIASDRLDGLEKQKAQLARDLEYIQGLRDAVDRLEHIFHQGLKRLQEFDFDARIVDGRQREASK
jgi:hypothetical protein